MNLIELDGSTGEGGGQILRTALALSMCTGQAMAIQRIRAKRLKPGLMRQHLTCVQGAVAVCGAKVEGAELAPLRCANWRRWRVRWAGRMTTAHSSRATERRPRQRADGHARLSPGERGRYRSVNGLPHRWRNVSPARADRAGLLRLEE
jgi:RNA 3'-terminal phosphate cyclase